MRILAICAVAATAVSAPAFAQGVPLEEYGTFANRGQCESALAHERNDQRKNADTRGSGYENLSESEFNRASRLTTTCQRNDDGEYQFFFDAGAYEFDSD